jgi:hypothetical protein
MPNSTPIVSQHLENISRTMLEEFQDLIRDSLRGRHGIYALYKGDKLYYVGLASNLRARLKQHLRNKHGENWDRFSVYLTIDDKAIKELETLLLRILKKSDGNRLGGRFVRSQNLAQQLKRNIQEHNRAQLSDLLGSARPIKPGQPGRPGESSTKNHNGARPLLSQYFNKRVVLRARYKQREYVARVQLDGTIRYAGKTYKSPSAAAAAVRGQASTGWHFWRYRRARGDWVRLETLRR